MFDRCEDALTHHPERTASQNFHDLECDRRNIKNDPRLQREEGSTRRVGIKIQSWAWLEMYKAMGGGETEDAPSGEYIE